jgi:predicted CXXCH cytochrome family protein
VSCAGCHRSHTAGALELRAAQTEEGVCFTCHGSAGPGTNVEPAFTAHANSSTRFFAHDVFAANGVHRPGEANGAYDGNNRHVECEDCHEPHKARRGQADAPIVQWEMNNVPGVDPVWTAPGGPASFSWLPQAEREYQVCFKCHSSFAALPDYLPDGWNGSGYVADGLPKLTYASAKQVPDSRDLAREFNPYNASFHPVAAPGRNQTIPSGSFAPGWSTGSLVYCSDCHTSSVPASEGSGPHGSALLHLLGGGANYQTANSGHPQYTGAELCFQCHNAADYLGEGPDTNFRRGGDNLHGKHRGEATCYLCHDTHGSEQLHLINLDVSVESNSRISFLPGYDGQTTDSQTFWQIDPGGLEKTCWIVCHGEDHRDKRYQNYGD